MDKEIVVYMYTYTMESFLGTKKNEIILSAENWMELGSWSSC